MIMTLRSWIVCAGSALLLYGCASSTLVAQWSDPQFAGQPPRGAKVMVVARRKTSRRGESAPTACPSGCSR